MNDTSQVSDGPESDVDCAAVPNASFEYYFEICHDTAHQWWVNGACNNGVKEEMSEIHRCATTDGSGNILGDRKYCHHCVADDGGRRMTLCGADQESKEKACAIALNDNVVGCGKQVITSYEHTCLADSGPGASLYDRREFWCEEERVYDNPKQHQCGKGWYYEFDSGDEVVFNEENLYCLNCGSMGVCARNEGATCEKLGLTDPVPKNKGEYALPLPKDMLPPESGGCRFEITLMAVAVAVSLLFAA